MATYVKYDTAIEKLCNKLIDAFGTTDIWRAVIVTDTPAPTTDSILTDVTQITLGSNGYPATPNSIGFDATRTGGTVNAVGTDVVWTASGGNLGNSTTGQWVVIYDDTATADDLWNYWHYGSTFTVANGETFTLDFGATFWSMT